MMIFRASLLNVNHVLFRHNFFSFDSIFVALFFLLLTKVYGTFLSHSLLA